MTSSPDTSVSLDAIEALRANLAKLVEAEDDARLDIKVAQSKASRITLKRKQIEKAIRFLTEDATPGLTKKALESLVAKALSQGPMGEDELRSRLESHLKNAGQSTSGLGLLLSKMRKSYADADGRWALPTPDTPAQHVAATAKQ